MVVLEKRGVACRWCVVVVHGEGGRELLSGMFFNQCRIGGSKLVDQKYSRIDRSLGVLCVSEL